MLRSWLPSLLIALNIGIAISRRHSLEPRRVPAWFGKGPNHGPYCAQPEQVALSYGGDPSTVWITWITFDDTYASVVEYGIKDLERNATGDTSLFIDGGSKKSKRYVHRVRLTELEPGITYFYHVGSEYGWSPIFRFTALQERPEGGYIYAVYGDLGNVNARSLGKIQQQAQRGLFDMVLHVG
ncbi:unnamed protein product [Anisakis simplex]|uniref:Acid phosphatase-related (inferred by orthology to a S. mansoni protein) n=1 Tax=Anisakis simplex TaxID=6269 RepID=A0A0M3J6E8_ANISI|nr:unnamed protein product [Anisakis simplex]